jgi:glycosyltransferase involved in cell wall biosynthesis
MTNSIPCTVQLLTYNSASTLASCLPTLAAFDEAIVQDGYSTDGTRDLVKRFPNVRILVQDRRFLNAEGRITDFGAMRNESIKAAKHDWILVVDADERVDPAMVEEVRRIVDSDDPGVYQAFRRFYVDGQKIMHSSWYPALQIRLFHRSLTEGYVKPIHERLQLKPGVAMRMLHSELPVPLPPASALTAKNERYLRMEARRVQGITWARWLRWVFLRNLRSIVGLSAKLALIWLLPRKGKRMPLSYEMQYIHHSWRTIWATAPSRVRVSRH